MKKILVSEKISPECRSALKKTGFGIVLLPPFDRLSPEVSSHADMVLFYDGERILTHEEYYLKNREIFDGLGVQVDVTSEDICEKYPGDVIFNAVLTPEGDLFSKTENTSGFIRSKAKRTIGVKQGYTACSTCRVADLAFITTDKGLFEKYSENGIDVLLVSKDGISLPGYSCGFIGGASFVTEDAVWFFGRAEDHPDFESIRGFVSKHGKKTVSLSSEKLTDIGGAVVVGTIDTDKCL